MLEQVTNQSENFFVICGVFECVCVCVCVCMHASACGEVTRHQILWKWSPRKL